MTHKSEVPVWPRTFVSPSSPDSRGAVVSHWGKYVHEVLVNRLGGQSLPRKSVVRLADHPDMTLDGYRGCTLMCLSIGTPKNNKFSICSKWKIHYFKVSQN